MNPISSTPLSPSSAQNRLNGLMKHGNDLINQLENQNSSSNGKIREVYQSSRKEIIELQNRLSALLNKSVDSLTPKDIKDLKVLIQEGMKGIASIVKKSNIQVAAEIAESKTSGVKGKAILLAEGGFRAFLIRLLSLVSKTHNEAVKAFNLAKLEIDLSSQTPSPVSPDETYIDSDKRTAIDLKAKALGKRVGVIGLGGVYRIEVTFSEEKIRKQVKSFIAQNLSERKRGVISHTMTFGKTPFTSKQTPLNKEFDKSKKSEKLTVRTFKKIFGKKGISSAHRLEPHLVNGWETQLNRRDKIIFRSLRHAVTSDNKENESVEREKNSKKAAEELIKAALIQEISDKGYTLEEAQKNGISLHFNSISLITPDDLRSYLPGMDDERRMLADQVNALKSFEKVKTITLDGKKIPVKLHVNAFNFGVNALTVNYKFGLENQYRYNLEAMKGFRTQFDSFFTFVSNLLKDQPKNTELKNAINNAVILRDDIEKLMRDKEGYLNGNNQYELGAKILNISFLMDSTLSQFSGKMGGIKSAFNCKSGKDRTGIMDAFAKTLAIYADETGKYPTHEEMTQNEEIQKKLGAILTKVLLEGGGLDITEINTGAKGYKVGSEARILGMPLDQFLQAQGLSATTSS